MVREAPESREAPGVAPFLARGCAEVGWYRPSAAAPYQPWVGPAQGKTSGVLVDRPSRTCRVVARRS